MKDAAVETMLDELDEVWRRRGLSVGQRDELRRDVAVELEAAAADGVDPRALLGPDVAVFAADLAEARGCHAPRPERWRILIGCLLGTTTGVAACMVATPFVARYLTSRVQLQHHYPVLGPFLAFCGVALVAVLSCAAGVAALLRGQPAMRNTLRRVIPGYLAVGLFTAGAAVAAAFPTHEGGQLALAAGAVLLVVVLPTALTVRIRGSALRQLR
ncbi:MAG: hypothetical protein ACTHQ3_02550 [Motilibacteraceae bacterium]